VAVLAPGVVTEEAMEPSACQRSDRYSTFRYSL
jgi:hypothetical protein